jgi:hypothetical protein
MLHQLLIILKSTGNHMSMNPAKSKNIGEWPRILLSSLNLTAMEKVLINQSM